MSDLPHEGIWTRLGVSSIHGVGVFAIRSIPAGTNVFANDGAPIRWVEAAAIADLPAASPVRRLYEDFAIRHGGRLGCPANFDLLTVGWYVNEPRPGEAASLAITPDYALLAARDIAEGEELTVVYATFSDPPAD